MDTVQMNDDGRHAYPAPPPYQPPKRRRGRKKWLGLAALAVVVFLVVLSAVLGSGPHQVAPVAATGTPTAAPATHVSNSGGNAGSAAVTPAPVTPTPAAPAPAKTPAMTIAQQQAVTTAQGYLSDGSGFSQSKLQQQLTSSYGSGFTQADARFAISYLHPDWDAQAVVAAKGYLSDGTGFSRSGLLSQLTSGYGSGFTYAEAEYALGQVGM